jgi:tetratricopeptide (TPR) repeat protein
VILKSPVWSRSNAAFMLEVALAAANQSRTPSLIAAGRSIVMSRPAPLGADPVEDRFEVLWHQSAIALVQASPQFFVQQDYLDAIGPRFEDAERRGVVLETRLPLARAISAGILCCWKRLPGEAAQPIPALSRGITLDKAVALFAMAAEVPVLRREALLRGARLLYENGRHADALAWFERMISQPEPAHGYVHHLTLGRVFDALNRPADAAAAYGAALTYVPDGQLAGIGRAAALLRSGRAEEAEAAAVEARRMPAGRRDFDRLRAFTLADLRFVPAWFVEIRKLRR